MKPEQFIREFGVEKAREVVANQPKMNATQYRAKDKKYSSLFKPSPEIVYVADLKRLVESFDLIEKLGGYGKCKFYMTGMKLNKCDSVKCPKTGLIVSRAALEIAINDYRKSIYGGGDE
ncbi:hypothetical protein AB3504_19395 [Acinetobacter baumannii]